MSRHHQFLDLYCYLPHEFLIAYPQPRLSFYNQEKKNNNRHGNTNALERTSSSRLSKCKPKNFLHPYKRSKDYNANDMHTSKRRLINKIMSIQSSDHEVEFYMKKELTRSVRNHHSSQMADGDKKNEKILKDFFDKFQQPRFINNQEHMMDQDLIRPVPCKPIFHDQLKQSSSFKNPISHLSFSQIDQSTLPLNRTSTWRKLQANITPSHFNHIQQFERDRQLQPHPLLSVPHPIMLSPMNKQFEIENSKTSKIGSNMTNSGISSPSVSIDSSTSSIESDSNKRIIQSINVDQQISDNDDDHSNVTIPVTSLLNLVHQSETDSKENRTIENEGKLLTNDSFTEVSVPNSPNVSSLQENIEEFQPVTELVSPSQIPSVLLDDILSSFFPTISPPLTSTSSSTNNNPHAFHSQHHTIENIDKTPYILFDHASDMTELLLIGQPPTLSSSLFIESDFISEKQPSKKVHSLSESIEELCLLIRKLLQHELSEQKITRLQATIANQLAILLTYLAIPRNEKIISELITKETIEKMTSTDEDKTASEKPLVLTIGTQTDREWTIQSNDQISKPILASSNSIHFHTEPVDDLVESEADKSSSFENKYEKILDLPPSTRKVTSHTELMSTSATLHLPGRRLNHALSDTFIYHIHRHQQYSSSYHQLISFSETTIHSLINHWSTKEKAKHLLQRIGQKFQHYIELESSNTCLEASTEFTPDFLLTTINNSKYDNDDDQTEQFGIDTEKQDYQTDTISLIINKNQDKIDTLTFNSTEKENCDSLELDIEQDNEEHSLFASFDIHQSNQQLNNEVKIEDDDIVSPEINQSDNKKHFCQLIEPLLNAYQWQVPVLPRRTNSIDVIYEKRTAKIGFKYLKIRSNSSNEINIIGKRVRIKSNPSSRASTPTIKSYSSQEQPKKLSILNCNNNYNEDINSIQSLDFSTSIVDDALSSTSIDSLCSLDSDTLDKTSTNRCKILPNHLRLLRNYSVSDELIFHSSLPNIHQNHDSLDKTVSSSAIISSHLLDVTDKFDSNTALAESLLDMLYSLNNNNSSTMKIDLLHMHIRQFLLEFDARIRLARQTRKTCKKKHKDRIY